MSLSRTLLLIALAAPVRLLAATPLVLTRSGHLLDASDAPVNATGLTLSFAIWSDVGSPEAELHRRWTSGECAVDVVHGRYAVSLGAGTFEGGCGTGLTDEVLPPGEARFVEVSVEGVALLPRLRVGTVPHAAYAAVAHDARSFGGLTPEAFQAATDERYVRLVDGGIDVSGAVKAQSFEGDGSKLTGVVAAALGSGAADDYVLAADLLGGTQVNDPANPVSWRRLKDVPDSIKDGVSTAPLEASRLADGAVTEPKLADEAVSASKLADEAVESRALAPGAVGAAALAQDGASLEKVSGGRLVPQGQNVAVLGGLRVGAGDGDCDQDRYGTLRWTDELQVCVPPGAWRAIALAGLGTSPEFAGESCRDLYVRGVRASGAYFVSAGGDEPFQVWCDMQNDGGGWTLVAKTTGNGTGHLSAADVNAGVLVSPATTSSGTWGDTKRKGLGRFYRITCGGATKYAYLEDPSISVTEGWGSGTTTLAWRDTFSENPADYTVSSSPDCTGAECPGPGYGGRNWMRTNSGGCGLFQSGYGHAGTWYAR